MTVMELSRAQLNELKEAFYWQEETMPRVPENVYCAEDIPDKLIFDYYTGTDFVNDDFFCSAITDVRYMSTVQYVLPF
jgi:hypothetical protein